MMKLIIVCGFLSFTAWAQEDKKVMEPIKLMFEGMKLGDSAMVGRAFYPGAVFHTVTSDPKTKQPVLRSEPIAGFLKAVGAPHKEVWNELIWSPKIEIDGNFAQVWVNYAFYLGTLFNHCGVDAFHLIKDETGTWKIFSGSDTRQKEGCNVPKEVSDQMK